MAGQRFTLRITQATDVEQAVQKIEQMLPNESRTNSSLNQLLLDTAHRFKTELSAATTTIAEASTVSDRRSDTRPNTRPKKPANVTSGKALIRGVGYSILVTTLPETAFSRLVDRLLLRPPAIT